MKTQESKQRKQSIINKLKLLFILILIWNNIFSQSNFKTRRITIFKTGLAQFEKETFSDVINNNVLFNKLPFSVDNNITINTDAVYNQFNQNSNILIGSIKFNAENNRVLETRTIPYGLRLVLEKNIPNQHLSLNYSQNGIMWIPTYQIELGKDQIGTVSLNASILNDIEDIENVELNLAVGYPYFPFSNIHSPISRKTSTREMMNLLNYQTNNVSNYNSQYSNENVVVLGYGETRKANINENKSSPVIQQDDFEDLFFYSKSNFSLQKNETVDIELIKFDVKYEDLYSVDLTSSSDIINYYGINYTNKQKNVVWHSIKFMNTTNSPLTSGIAFINKKNGNEIKYLSQSQIKHTPVNRFVSTKVAIAPDIIINDLDNEEERESVNRGFIATIKAEVEIINSKNQLINLEISRVITGKLLSSDITWENESLPLFNSDYNFSNNVKWLVNIEPNSSKKVSYSYKIKCTQ